MWYCTRCVVRDLLSERDLPAGAHRFGVLTLLVPPTDAVMLQVDPRRAFPDESRRSLSLLPTPSDSSEMPGVVRSVRCEGLLRASMCVRRGEAVCRASLNTKCDCKVLLIAIGHRLGTSISDTASSAGLAGRPHAK